MKKKAIELLEKHGYKVLPELNFIVEDSLIKPIAHIVYDEEKNRFGIMILPMVVFGNENLNRYTQEIASKLDLIDRLNFESNRGDSNVRN